MGFCWPCTSLHGGIYFAASAHICVGIFMTGYLIYNHVQNITNYNAKPISNQFDAPPNQSNSQNEIVSASATDGFFTICIIYAMAILILGLCTFNGVEKKSPRLLKTSAITFGIVHGIIFLRVVYVIISELVLSLTNTDIPSKGASSSTSFGIIFFTFLFFTTIIYLALLTMYIRELQAANSSGNIFSQIQLGVGVGDGNPLYAYNTVQCHP